jgi:fructose-1,6-bisphosphatase/inositol monophosphatase family enzyme
MGDFWIYHLVAQGKVDIMMEGSVKFWDIAAAKVIVEEAGLHNLMASSLPVLQRRRWLPMVSCMPKPLRP